MSCSENENVFNYYLSPIRDVLIYQTVTFNNQKQLETKSFFLDRKRKLKLNIEINQFQINKIIWSKNDSFFIEASIDYKNSNEDGFSKIYKCHQINKNIKCNKIKINSLISPQLGYLTDDETNIFIYGNKSNSEIYKFKLENNAEIKSIKEFVGNINDYWNGYLYHSQNGKLYFAYEDLINAVDIYEYDLHKNTIEKITKINQGINLNSDSKIETLIYPSFDSYLISGVLIFPKDYSSKKKYPLIIDIHGGPGGAVRNGQFLQTSLQRYQKIYANEGYFVFLPNYRGTYSGQSSSLLFRKTGLSDVQDIIYGLKYLQKNYNINKNIGVIGHSYGGFLAAKLAEDDQYIKASIIRNGIVDWLRLINETFMGKIMNIAYFRYSVNNGREFYAKISPIKKVNKIKIPILLIHGTNDKCPFDHIKAYYTELLSFGKNVELIEYKNEGHVISKPHNIEHMINSCIVFFNHHLK